MDMISLRKSAPKVDTVAISQAVKTNVHAISTGT
jgi:hypothetical protein